MHLRLGSPVRDRGFTLIELMVVISIIGLLVALLVPVYQSTQRAGRATKCLSNLRQIATACQLYLQENDQIMPQRFYFGDTGYKDLLLPYLDEEGRVFQCPEHPQVSYPNQPSYGMNWYYDNTTVMRVENPGRTIMLAETSGSSGLGSHRADRDSIDPGQIADTRHSGTAHYAFFDGHIQRLKHRETIMPLDMWGEDQDDHDQEWPGAPVEELP